jgi:hypothetical protein
MRKAAGCVLLAILCLLGASYLPRILQEAQTDREQQNLISGYIQNPDTTDEENTESTTDEPEEETDPNMIFRIYSRSILRFWHGSQFPEHPLIIRLL